MPVEKKLNFKSKRLIQAALVASMLACAAALPSEPTLSPIDVSGINPGSSISATGIKGIFTAFSNNDTAINNSLGALEDKYDTISEDLQFSKWEYDNTNNIVTYSGTGSTINQIGIGISATDVKRLNDLADGGGAATMCIANTRTDGTGYDPNQALKIVGGSVSGTRGALIQFYKTNFTRLGWISREGEKVSYNETSDRRLKDGIVDAPYALDRLMKIQVRKFYFKSDPAKRLQDGFIAQELYEVYPEAVSKPDTEEGTWGVDYGRLSPIIVKSIQDQQATIEELKAENADLKARLAAIERKLGIK